MAGVSPVVLIQMLLQYQQDMSGEKTPRTFIFTRNNRMRVHKETQEEVEKRKSYLDTKKVTDAKNAVTNLLKKSLNGRVGKVWIHPDMKKIAVPLQMSTGQTGYGVLPTGSHIDIPEGKFIRAFTYWEKVNDIDLSCFAINKDGREEEFSWRNMWNKQGSDIAYSGDQTSGYNGGSEYFDIDIDLFKQKHPDFRYLVFSDNVYSDATFDKCQCFAGFMIRESNPENVPFWKGEKSAVGNVSSAIFDPKTVATSFRINADSTFAYLFAIDLEKREMIWLNLARADRVHVAGSTSMNFLTRYFTITDCFNLAELYSMAGTPVENIEEADIILSDEEVPGELRTDQEFITSSDLEKVFKVLT